MENDFRFCPKCSSRNIVNYGNRKWTCPDCGFTLYNNTAGAVGIIFFDDESNVLFEVRAKNPRKGKLALPGGFIDPDESAEEACSREAKEEIGLTVNPESLKYLCSFPNVYPYKDIIYKTIDMFFCLKVQEPIPELIKKLNAEESEVTAFEYHKVCTKDDVKALDIAFGSSVESLSRFVDFLKK